MTHAFQSGVFKLAWDVMQIEAAGASSIDRFKSRDRVIVFLNEVHVSPTQIDSQACVRHAVAVVSGEREPLTKVPLSEPVAAVADTDAAPPPESVAPEPPEPEPPSEEAALALADGTVTQMQFDERAAAQAETRAAIEQAQIQGAAKHADAYVEQGFITAEDGETLRQICVLDERVASGEIDSDEGSRLRNSLLSGEARDELDHKLKGAVDHAVRFLEVFEAMKRITKGADEALRFLIHCKDILIDERSAAATDTAVEELIADTEVLQEVIDLMDRKDQEIRMISVCLPPYSHIVRRGTERIGNLVIEEEFVDQLRELDAEAMSEVLNSADPQVRTRPAADMKCLIAIINHLLKPTPWRKEIRLLKVQLTIEDFYRDTDNMEEARRQAESFLKRRLRRVFVDMTDDERSTIEERGSEMIDSIEAKMLAERQAAEAEAVAANANRDNDNSGGADDDLSEDEEGKGAQIGRVEMRVAGQMRTIPYKIILDPDDPEQHVIAQRDPETDELRPMLRRGAKRVIQKGRDGKWRIVTR